MIDAIDSPPLAITFDNIHLSEPIRTGWPPACADVCTRQDDGQPETSADVCTDPDVLRFIEAATSANTRRAYDSDLRHFLAWVAPSLPPRNGWRNISRHTPTHFRWRRSPVA